MAHLSRAIEISLNEVPNVPDKSNFLTRLPILRRHIFTKMTFPKGKIKAPDFFLPPATEEFEAERDRYRSILTRFVEALEESPDRTGLSSIFGPVPLRDWSYIHGSHIHHHALQYGIVPAPAEAISRP